MTFAVTCVALPKIVQLWLRAWQKPKFFSPPNLTEPGEKPILHGAVVKFIGKMTKETIKIPSCKPMPKFMNSVDRLGLFGTGVIIAKVGVSYFLSLDNQLSGSDLTIECLDRALANLQEEYMVNAPKLYIQGDNHTD